MLYYINTELKKALKKKYTRYYPIGIILTALLANAAMSTFRNIYYGTNDGTFAYNLIMFAKGFFWIPYYACWFAADNVFGEEYPNPLIRDKSTIGLSRTKMYFGKLIVSEIIMCLCAIFATVAFLLITWVFQTHDGTIDMTVVLDFVEAVLITMPLFITGVSISNAFLFYVICTWNSDNSQNHYVSGNRRDTFPSCGLDFSDFDHTTVSDFAVLRDQRCTKDHYFCNCLHSYQLFYRMQEF